MGTILDQIVETKRDEVAEAKRRRTADRIRDLALAEPPPRNFFGALTAPSDRGIHVIAEIKRKSPSAGLIRPDFDPVALARIYAANGASALSVLTDVSYFDGRLDYLRLVKAAVPLPVLRKDFLIDPYQVYESRAAGADAVLLIGEILPPAALAEMLALAGELRMATLVEVHEAGTLSGLLEARVFEGATGVLLGINNRDLKVQRTDLATTEALIGRVPSGLPVVAESGLKTRADVERMRRAGARALLIGETFMAAPDVGARMAEMLAT